MLSPLPGTLSCTSHTAGFFSSFKPQLTKHLLGEAPPLLHSEHFLVSSYHKVELHLFFIVIYLFSHKTVSSVGSPSALNKYLLNGGMSE